MPAPDASSYDQVPYTSLAFPQTHPDHLASVARIFGLSPPSVGACRVLELGCASGGNLVPMAFNLPGSEFVGVDLSTQQVADAQMPIRALGLRNIRIEAASILDIDERWGAFDYIICHGVFSWVETAVQDKILQIAANSLARDGVAYVSYNTYPGWHMRGMVRDMMRYHARQFEEPQEQIDQARALLKFLAFAADGTGPYGQLLTTEAERLGGAPDSYLFHEHLERTNLPVYFHQFVERAERAGLQYLSEATVSEMLTAHFPPAVRDTLERISPDLLHLEQYMDFIRNRQFRQTLLCHETLHPVRALSPNVLPGLMMSSTAKADAVVVDLTAGTPVVFTNRRQRAEVAKPATKAALETLTAIWPRAVDVDRLCERALERAAPFLGTTSMDEARQGMLEDLFGGVMYGLIRLHTVAPPCTNLPSEKPRAHPVAAFFAESGSVVVNAHHDMFELDPLSLQILKLSTGERTRGEMLDILVEWFESGRLSLDDEGEAVTDSRAARAELSHRLEKALATLTRSAVLIE